MCWIRYSSATINSQIRRTCSGQYNLDLKNREADMLPRAVESWGGHPDVRAECKQKNVKTVLAKVRDRIKYVGEL